MEQIEKDNITFLKGKDNFKNSIAEQINLLLNERERANQSRQYVEEFCKTKLSFVDGWFQIDFIFDNENIENLDPEFAFKGRCKKFLAVFDICNLDNNLKIRLRCIDKILENSNIYCLEIARKYANITINSEEQNIPNYLKSKIFYTKEEYATL